MAGGASVERVGQPGSRLTDEFGDESAARDVTAPDHAEAIRQLHALLRERDLGEIRAIGHRVVHGGERFRAATQIDDEVECAIEALIPLAPLHNPPSLAGIRAARAAFPGAVQVEQFKCMFFQRPVFTFNIVEGSVQGKNCF